MASKPKSKSKSKPPSRKALAEEREKKKARIRRKQPVPKPEEERPQGRPSDYREEYDEAAYRACLLGDTDAELAIRFGVCERTINGWKQKYPSFLQSLTRGKAIADGDMAHALFNRGIGAKWTEGVAFKCKTVIYGDNGRKIREDEEIRVAEVQRGAPPDTNAAKHWLNNRRPDRWKEKIEVDTKDTTSLVDKLRTATQRVKTVKRDEK